MGDQPPLHELDRPTTPAHPVWSGPLTVLFHALALLCALGSVAFATVATGRWYVVSGLPVGFVVAIVWIGPEQQPDPAWLGGTVALVTGAALAWSGLLMRALTGIAGGALAGVWGGLLQKQGLPAAPALVLAASLPSAAVFLTARRPTFATNSLKEEALLAMCGLGLVVAVGPTVSAGWGSAGALNLDPGGGVRQVVETWVMLMSGVSIVLGGWHSLRRRR